MRLKKSETQCYPYARAKRLTNFAVAVSVTAFGAVDVSKNSGSVKPKQRTANGSSAILLQHH